jgi:dihydropteroate synthase-like protein
MSERLLFLTGHLAKPRLEKILREAGLGEAAVHNIGVKVAALMTEAIIARRLSKPVKADKIVLPGRVRVDLDKLSTEFGVPFVRGPDELKDLPKYLGRGGAEPDLTNHDLRIFAEIVDASAMAVDSILAKSRAMAKAGADVIDIGCLPDTPFPHLEDAVRALKAEGFRVSVDSADPDELKRGAKAGADFLLSLTGETLHVADGHGAVPILIPSKHGDLASLFPAVEAAEKRGLRYIVDPILDPIHFGFAKSLERYIAARARLPGAEMLMGTGNLTELTDADSGGVTAMLLGICSELGIRNVLTVQVSPHTRRTIEEHDAARRMMFAAKRDESLPRDYSAALLALHDRVPFAATSAEVAANARDVRDRNFRIETAEDGVHVYNADGHHIAEDALSLFPKLGVEKDGAHAFYLAAELTKAEIAFKLGKRYVQDEPLDWGAAADRPAEDMVRLAKAGHTLRAKEAD